MSPFHPPATGPVVAPRTAEIAVDESQDAKPLAAAMLEGLSTGIVVASLVIGLFGSSLARAQSTVRSRSAGRLYCRIEAERHVTLDPVSSQEFTGGTAFLAVERTGDLPYEPVIVREVDQLWRILLPLDNDDELYAFDIGYQVLCDNGRENCFSHHSSPSDLLPVRIHDLGVEELETPRGRVITGGIRLEFQTGRVRLSGRYTGSIRVTINGI